MNAPHSERRQWPRTDFRVLLHYRSTALHAAETLDISEGGMALVTTEAIPVGAELELFLINKNVRVSGTVRDQVPLDAECYRTGLHFPKPEPELVQLLLAGVGTSVDRDAS